MLLSKVFAHYKTKQDIGPLKMPTESAIFLLGGSYDGFFQDKKSN